MPTIDGIYSAGEWNLADETSVNLSYYVNFPFYVYTMNDDSFLYLCIDAVGDMTTSGSHTCGVFFDTDEDGMLTSGAEDGVQALFSGLIDYKNWDGLNWTTQSSSANGVPFTGGSHDEAGMN